MPGVDPSGIATGAGSAAVGFTIEVIRRLAAKFRAKELQFADPADVADGRGLMKAPEWKLYDDHIKDTDLRRLVFTGLLLRLHQQRNEPQKLQVTRAKMYHRHGASGVRVAQVAQTGVLRLVIAFLLEKCRSEADLTANVERYLKELDKHAVFVETLDRPERITRECAVRLAANLPPVFTLCGLGKASPAADAAAKALSKQAVMYTCQKLSQPGQALSSVWVFTLGDEGLPPLLTEPVPAPVPRRRTRTRPRLRGAKR